MIAFSKLLCGSAMLATLGSSKDNPADAPDAIPGKPFRNGARDALQALAAPCPSVAWNVSYRCNLNCSHCALGANLCDVRDELTTAEACAMIEDLAAMRVPVLLFSGGEPLMRKDMLDLACFAALSGLHTVLSTNGTLIDRSAAQRIRDAGIEYAAISLDGLQATHNLFRRNSRAFQDAVQGIRCCNEAGVKTGIRFTLNSRNYHDLPGILDLAEELKVLRFCMGPLVYSGRGNAMTNPENENPAPVEATAEQWRSADSLLIEKALDWDRRGIRMEVLTTDPHADGAYIHVYITSAAQNQPGGESAALAENPPDCAGDARRLLEMHGGCSAGCRMWNVDPQGNVRACRFWGHAALGNVRVRKFSEIWREPNRPAPRLLPVNVP